jgi:hypothetical protein
MSGFPHGGGGGPATSPAINVTTAGIVADGVTDQTANVKALLASAVTAAQVSGTNYVELYFPPGIYQFSGAPTQGGATHGNAQIPLPVIATTLPKVIIVFRSGFQSGDTLPHWQQLVGQRSGAVFRSTNVGTNDATFGECSILGGPTPKQGYGNSGDSTFLFNNVHLIVDGISFLSATMNPTMCGLDARGCAELTIGTAGAFCDVGTPTMIAGPAPTHTWVFGCSPPNDGNNDICNIGSWSCEGYYLGIILTEHVVAKRICSVYCQVGMTVLTQNYAHGNTVQYASIEACVVGISWQSYQHVIVQVLDIEDANGTPYAPTFHVLDASNNARGYVGFEVTGGGEGEGTEPLVSGATNLNIQNLGRKAATFGTGDGLVAVPASNTPLLNPYWKNASVFLSGGTVTAVQVNAGGVGLRTVATSTPCTFALPSGATVQLTYSVAPTWVWTLLS